MGWPPRRVVSNATTVAVNSSTAPTWLPAAGSWGNVNLPSSTPRARADATVAGTHGQGGYFASNRFSNQNLWVDYTGGMWNPFIGGYGAWVIRGGGHATNRAMLDTGTYVWNTSDRLWERYSDPVYPGDCPPIIPGFGWGCDNQRTDGPAWELTPYVFPEPYASTPSWANYSQYGEITSNPTDGYIPAADHNRYAMILVPPGLWGMGPKGGLFLPCTNSNHVSASHWQAHIFSFDTRKWARVGNNRTYTSPKIGTSGCMDAYGNVYHWEGDTYAVRRLLHNDTTWSTLSISNIVSTFGIGVGSMVWLPGSVCKNRTGALVMLSGRDGGTFGIKFSAVDLDATALAAVTPGGGIGLSGTQPVVGGSSGDEGAGLVWCPDLGALVFWSWHSSANNAVYAIYPPVSPFTQNWTCSVLSASNAPTMNKTGIPNWYNKFQYAPELQAFFVVGDANVDDMWCFRPAGITSPPSFVPSRGKYTDLTTNLASSVDPCPSGTCIYSANSKFESIWDAWNGGVFAKDLGASGSMLHFGGGHYAYYGNEVVRFDIATRTWSRLSTPALYGPGYPGWTDADSNPVVGPYGNYPDGSPYPIHTNMGVCYLPPDAGGGTNGSFVYVSHDQTGITANAVGKLWRFDLAVGLANPTTLPCPAWSVFPAAGSLANWQSDGSQQRHALTYDSKRKGVWFMNYLLGGQLSFISFLTNTETVVTKSGAGANWNFTGQDAPPLTYVAHKDCLVSRDSFNNLCVADLSNFNIASPTSIPCAFAATSGTPASGYSSTISNQDLLEYCEYDGCLYLLDWYVRSEARLFRLMPPPNVLTGTWQWSYEVLAKQTGAETLQMRGSGTGPKSFEGKFRYAPAIKSFVWTDGSTLKPQICRPWHFV